MSDPSDRLFADLLVASHLVDFDRLGELVAEHAASAGMDNATIYVTDLQEQFLVALPARAADRRAPAERLPIDASMAGRSYRGVQTVRGHGAAVVDPPTGAGNARLWAPLVEGAERVGVLGADVGEVTDDVVRRVQLLASLVALFVVSKRYHSDTYARLIRARPLTLSAEVLWTLMPVGTFANGRVIVTAALEPAYTVGGDAFDYAVSGDLLHLSLFDAMGHDTAAGLTSSVAMGSCRNNRRHGGDLMTTADAIDRDIAELFGGTGFATGIVGELDTRTGALTWVNRAHPPPLLIRDGRVSELASEPGTPLGLGLGVPPALARVQLAPGDRLLLFSDGIVEARSPAGEQFGLARFTDFVVRHETAGLTAPETVRRLIRAVLEHQGGRLNDDATVLVVEWTSQDQERLVPERPGSLTGLEPA